MNVRVTVVISAEEVREAVREWMEKHGVPNILVEKLYLERPSINDKNTWVKLDGEQGGIRARVEYEAASLAGLEPPK